MKMFINGVGCVAPQDTNSKPLFEELNQEEVLQTSVVKPNYKEYIAPAKIRRMGKAIKMGIVACTDALKDAQVEMPGAIIAGTGLGCQQDSEKFLTSIINDNEQFLTPTSFIQSTHNTVAGQVALMLKCKAYNFTYCHRGFSFENALVDAELTFLEKKANDVLVFGIDEMTEHTRQVFQRINWNIQEPINILQLLEDSNPGTVYGEGTSSFVLSSEKTENTYGAIEMVDMLYKPSTTEVEQKLSKIANEHNVDLVLTGYNGDPQFDKFYPNLEEIFPTASIGAFKHLVGEYHTASAFALWLSCQVLKDQHLPQVAMIGGQPKSEFNNILIYNHYNNLDHSFILIKK